MVRVNRYQLARTTGHRLSEVRYSLEEYIGQVAALGGYAVADGGLIQSYDQAGHRRTVERAESAFANWVGLGLKRNSVVFACELARLGLFTEARFQWQQMRGGRPGDLFGTPDLRVLEKPWPNGSTGDLLGRILVDVDFAGNAYVRRTSPNTEPRLERLRPDWVDIILGEHPDLFTLDVVGYQYHPGGRGAGGPVLLTRGEVAHWLLTPDPVATYRGMSWLTPVIREMVADNAATDHKQRFFDRHATPNLIIRFDKAVAPAALDRFKAQMEEEHSGFRNAYKNLYLGGGADVTIAGSTFKDMDYKGLMAGGETRIAAASGVGAVIAQLSEGLAGSSLNAGNFSAARRRFADLTIRPAWRSCCAALETVAPPPSGARLWYDDRDIPALQEDEKDAADIQAVQASTIGGLVREGFTPESAVSAVINEDMRLLVHTGRVSVQLFDPTTPTSSGAGPSSSEEVSP